MEILSVQNENSLSNMEEVWLIGMIGASTFCVTLITVVTVLIWRRHAREKAIGHVGG